MKKRMFNIIFMAAIITIVTAITGCGDQKEDINSKNNDVNDMDSDKNSQKTEEIDQNMPSEDKNEKDDSIAVGFSLAGSISDYNTAMADSISDIFREEDGYTLLIEDAGNNQEQQFTTIRSFIDKNMDYIIAAPLGENDEWETVLKEANQAEIPVILLGNRIEAADEQLYTAWVGSDYLQEGYDASDWLEEYLEEKEKTEETQIIAMVAADAQDSMASKERFQGFLEQKELSKIEHWEIKEELSIEKVQELLESDEKIDVIVCENDQIALEILEMLDKIGKTYGTGGDIIIISFGASKAGLQAVADGKINVELEQNLSYGPYVEDIVKRLRAGDEIDKIQYVMEGIFTMENVEE